FSSRRRHTRSKRDWSSDVCSSDLMAQSGLKVAPGIWVCGLLEVLDRRDDELTKEAVATAGAVAKFEAWGANLDRRLAYLARDPQIGRASCRERVRITYRPRAGERQ